MATGIFIKTFPLTGYPSASQALMSEIADNFEKNFINVTHYKGSYSIKKKNAETAVKILCTIGSNVNTEGAGVAVLFRAEFINGLGFEKVNTKFSNLEIRKVLFKVGGGKYEDFYLTKIDSVDTYNKKVGVIIELSQLILK